jgi:hypothetical protein
MKIKVLNFPSPNVEKAKRYRIPFHTFMNSNTYDKNHLVYSSIKFGRLFHK